VKQDKNIHQNKNIHQTTREPKSTGKKSLETSACRTRAFSGNPPTSDDLQKSRTGPFEARKASRNPHARGQEGRPPACAGHAPNMSELHGLAGDHRDRRGPRTATGRFLSKKNQPRLIDLALNNISTGNPPTPAFLHEPKPEVLCLHQKRQSKTKKKKTTASANANTGRKNSNSLRLC